LKSWRLKQTHSYQLLYLNLWFQRKSSLLGFFFISLTPQVTCLIIRALWFTTFFLFCACFTVTIKNYGRSQLFTWTRCGDVDITFTVQNCTVTITREIRMCIHTLHIQNIILFQNSYAKPYCNWRKLHQKAEKVSESVVSMLQSNDSKNSGSGLVYLFVTWDPNILHQAFNNLEAISEPDHLTNAYAGCCVRKQWNMWLVNFAWDSKHVFIHGPTQSVKLGRCTVLYFNCTDFSLLDYGITQSQNPINLYKIPTMKTWKYIL